MNITLTPDTYTPSVDDAGNYIDTMPKIVNGIYCVCGARKNKVYENASKFNVHIKSKSHQKWLLNLNNNKANYYVEKIKLEEVVKQQQHILTNMESKLRGTQLTIDYLTKQLTRQLMEDEPLIDLLDINE
jgi:hypothetical protein